MKSKHTKAGRRYRRRRHHVDLSREAWEAYQGRPLLLWMKAQMRASSCPWIRAEAERIRTVAVAAGGGS